MTRPAPRNLEVIQCHQITPNMRRVTLGGDAMDSFPENKDGAYVKLIFPQKGDERPTVRTYTIRQQRQSEIDIDFALHDNPGPASDWAVSAQPGDSILVGGPGPQKLINQQADWHLLVGDMTALPAISVNLSQLPKTAIGYVIIEVPTAEDIQPLDHPENIQLRWAINPNHDPEGEFLASQIHDLPWLPGTASVWSACEFNSMRAIRNLIKRYQEIPRSHLYISSYWKMGQSEDEHKVTKKKDTEISAG